MNCPKCHEKLVSEQYRLKNYLLCFYCEGAWLRKMEIEEHGLIGSLTKAKEATLHDCPDCMPAKKLSIVTAQGCELEFCESCLGMFFDKGELEKFSARYKDVDGKSLAQDAAAATLTLMAIARMVSSLFRFLSR